MGPLELAEIPTSFKVQDLVAPAHFTSRLRPALAEFGVAPLQGEALFRANISAAQYVRPLDPRRAIELCDGILEALAPSRGSALQVPLARLSN